MIFRKTILFVCLLSVLESCNNYKKIQQSTNYEYKYEMAEKYYAKKDYEKASELYKELIQAFRGTSRTEEIFFKYAYCDFYMEDYFSAPYKFRQFIQSFPRSERCEEAQYMTGVCYQRNSPSYYLDQEYTVKAIEEFQLFLDKYPKGKYSDVVNNNVEELLYKLEKKSYETAKLYHKIGEYRSSVVAGDNFCREFPDSKHTEEIRYMMVLACYDYAEKSIEDKQIERFMQVSVYADKYIKHHPKSPKIEELEKLKQKSAERIKGLRFKLPIYYFNKSEYVKAMSGFDELLASGEFSDKTAEIIYYKLKSQYQYALGLEADKRIDGLKKFRSLFEQNKGNESFVSSAFYKEIEKKYEVSENTIAKLPSQIGDEYYNFLNFEKAAKYYYEYANSIEDQSVKRRFLIKGLDSEIKDAERSPVFEKYEKYQSIVSNFNSNLPHLKGFLQEQKALNLLAVAQKEIDAYPLWLFKDQYEKKQYAWVKFEVQKYLKEDKLGKYRDEIVYLWALSEYNFAKKSDKYERLDQYNQALEHIQKIEKMTFNDQRFLQKVIDVKNNTNAKIEKLIKSNHGLQKN